MPSIRAWRDPCEYWLLWVILCPAPSAQMLIGRTCLLLTEKRATGCAIASPVYSADAV